MLEQVTHIEGLNYYEDHELYDDTSPGSVQTKFLVVSEEMPFLTAKEGKPVRRNFIHVERTWELGRSSYRRRVHDDVIYNEDLQKWEILKLAYKTQSDIIKNPNEWNAFMRGVSTDEAGTPLSMLFPHDPSRVEFYHFNHIKTIERLAGLNLNDRKELGMGVDVDAKKAERYLEKLIATAPSIAMTAKLEEKDKQINNLQAQLTELSTKLTELLQARLEEAETIDQPKKRGRPTKLIE